MSVKYTRMITTESGDVYDFGVKHDTDFQELSAYTYSTADRLNQNINYTDIAYNRSADNQLAISDLSTYVHDAYSYLTEFNDNFSTDCQATFSTLEGNLTNLQTYTYETCYNIQANMETIESQGIENTEDIQSLIGPGGSIEIISGYLSDLYNKNSYVNDWISSSLDNAAIEHGAIKTILSSYNSNKLSRIADGNNTMLANLDMNKKTIVNLAAITNNSISNLSVDSNVTLGYDKDLTVRSDIFTYNLSASNNVSVGKNLRVYHNVEEGSSTTASGDYSHAEGSSTTAFGNYSHAEGYNNSASGDASHAEGTRTTASENYSHAEGYNSYATGKASHAEGSSTTASENYSHAEGYNSYATGKASHAEGSSTTASGNYSHAGGYNNSATGDGSNADGMNTFAEGRASHSEGHSTVASADFSHAEGDGPTASGIASHAEGYNTIASGNYSHAEGSSTTASGPHSHAEGNETIASGSNAHSEGSHTQATSWHSHAEGLRSVSSGETSHAEGFRTTSSNRGTHSEGYGSKASGIASHAEGISSYYVSGLSKQIDVSYLGENPIVNKDKNYYYLAYPIAGQDEGTGESIAIPDHLHGCTLSFTYNGTSYSSVINRVLGISQDGADDAFAFAVDTYEPLNNYLAGGVKKPVTITYSKRYGDSSGTASHTEGYDTIASGDYSHAEGEFTNATGRGSHAEGYQSIAMGEYSHAEGNSTEGLAIGSHAEGNGSRAMAKYSHAEGTDCSTYGENSHAQGNECKAYGKNSHAQGNKCEAYGENSMVSGVGNQTWFDGEFVTGRYAKVVKQDPNNPGWKRLFAVGNGVPYPRGDMDAFAIYNDNKVEGNAVENSAPTANSKKLITSNAVYNALQGKTDKVVNATNGDFAILDVNGNLRDSGKKSSDFAAKQHEHSYIEISQDSLNGSVAMSVNPTQGSAIYLTVKNSTIGNKSIYIDRNNIEYLEILLKGIAYYTEKNNNKLITSNAVYNALQGKQNILTFDNTPTPYSNNPVTSGGVYDAINNISPIGMEIYTIKYSSVSSDNTSISIANNTTIGNVSFNAFISDNEGRIVSIFLTKALPPRTLSCLATLIIGQEEKEEGSDKYYWSCSIIIGNMKYNCNVYDDLSSTSVFILQS